MSLSRLALAAAGLALCSSTALAGSTSYPVKVNNCGFTYEYKAAPKNVVSIGQGTTEILYAIGAGDNMAGTALWFAKILPEFEAVNAKVGRIADNVPSFEAVVAKKPGLVATQFAWMIGEQGTVGSRAQFLDVGVPTYVMPDDCDGKDNSKGGDGIRKSMYSPEYLYKGITQLAEIFDRQAKGTALIADLKAREAKAVAKAKTLNLKGESAVVWFSSPDFELDPYVAGKFGPAAYVLNSVGLKNVIEVADEWPTVGWETIAKVNPTYLVLAKMDRRRFPADDVEKKIEFLKTDPVASQMEAVKKGRIVIVAADSTQSSLRTIYGLEKFVDDLAELKK